LSQFLETAGDEGAPLLGIPSSRDAEDPRELLEWDELNFFTVFLALPQRYMVPAKY